MKVFLRIYCVLGTQVNKDEENEADFNGRFINCHLRLIDDWYKSQYYNKPGIGRKEEMTDSEILTLIMAMSFMEFTSERHYLEFMRANYKYLFPNLLDQSQYNRRARHLTSILDLLRLVWANDLGLAFQKYFLLDTSPVITVGYRRNKSHSDFLGSANYGYCPARKLKYFGYKFVMISPLDGIPGAFELVPANTDERAAADQVLDRIPSGSLVIKDLLEKIGKAHGLKSIF